MRCPVARSKAGASSSSAAVKAPDVITWISSARARPAPARRQTATKVAVPKTFTRVLMTGPRSADALPMPHAASMAGCRARQPAGRRTIDQPAHLPVRRRQSAARAARRASQGPRARPASASALSGPGHEEHDRRGRVERRGRERDPPAALGVDVIGHAPSAPARGSRACPGRATPCARRLPIRAARDRSADARRGPTSPSASLQHAARSRPPPCRARLRRGCDARAPAEWARGRSAPRAPCGSCSRGIGGRHAPLVAPEEMHVRPRDAVAAAPARQPPVQPLRRRAARQHEPEAPSRRDALRGLSDHDLGGSVEQRTAHRRRHLRPPSRAAPLRGAPV